MTKDITNKDWCSKSTVRMVRMSPRKVNIVASMVRGLSVSEAVSLLHLSQKKASVYIRKCLLSCIANAKRDINDESLLYVSECYVGKNMTLKRLYYCNKGKRGIMRKEFSQVTIILKKEESNHGSES